MKAKGRVPTSAGGWRCPYGVECSPTFLPHALAAAWGVLRCRAYHDGPGIPFVWGGALWRPGVLTWSGKRRDTLCRKQCAAYRRQTGRLACARTWGETCSLVRGWPVGVPPLIPVHALGRTGLLSTSVGAEREAPLNGSWPGGWPGQVHSARRAL